MKLIQVRDKAESLAIRQACFSFEVPGNIAVLLHEIRIEGQTVGYVATEDYNTVGGPHIYIGEGFKNAAYMRKVNWIFKNVYCPLMKELGKRYLVTNCDDADTGTINFLKKAGFSTKNITVAEYIL